MKSAPDSTGELRGARVVLEPQTRAHADAMFALLDDDALWVYTDPPELTTREALRERYRRLESRRSPDGTERWLNWAVTTAELGLTGFVQAGVPAGGTEATIGYVIARRFWSQGLGTEAVGVMLEHLREALGVRLAVAYVDRRNVASLKLLHSLGFALVRDDDPQNLRLERPLGAIDPVWESN